MVTIEDSVVIPVFTIIIVSLIMVTLYIHDVIITENLLYQGGIKLERMSSTTQKSKAESTQQSELKVMGSVQENIEKKTVIIQHIHVKESAEHNEVNLDCQAEIPALGYFAGNRMSQRVSVTSNYPPDFIRKVNAAKQIWE